MKTQRVRLDDIAKRAGVSKMSVSLALRNDGSVSQEMRRRIHELAQEMGFVPNKIARGLTSGKTYTIAAMVGGAMHDDYHNRFLKGATDCAIERGYTLTIGLTEGDSELERKMLSSFQQMMVDGYLVFHSVDVEAYRSLQQQGVPFVLYTKYFDNLDCDYVVCDDVLGGSMMTHHFIGCGHERIAFVYDKGLKNSSEVKNRIIGYKQALAAAGIPIDESLLLPYSYSFERDNFAAANPELVQCLGGKDRPTAIFVCNDVVASAFYIAIKRMGFRIPEDISIGGYEGVYLGNILDPSLTTVSSPIERMGRDACNLLLDRIEKKLPDEGPIHIQLEPMLTIRNSTNRR